MAQCAAVFGGGIEAYADMPLLELLHWTHRAITLRSREDG